MHAISNRAGSWARLLAPIAFMVALACQLALGAADPRDRPDDALSLQAAGIMCRSHPAPDHAPPHHHAAPALCTLASALGHGGFLPAVEPAGIQAPLVTTVRTAILPPARAPPASARSTAYPRGPPVLT